MMMSLDRRLSSCLARVGLVGALVCGAGVLSAQSLRDPTMPPDAAASTAVGVGGAVAVPEPPTSLVRDADGRYRLLHDGRWLQVGQRLGSARITRITETEVWLQTDGETRKWTRYPAVSVRPVTPLGSRPAPLSTPQTGRTLP